MATVTVRTKQPVIVNNIATNLAPFNEKQVDYMLACKDSWLNVAEGGKRAGKNVMNIAMWCDDVDNHDDFLHIVGGVTSSSAKVNILDCNGYGVLAYFEHRIVKDTYQGLEAYYVDTPKGQKVIIPVGMGNSDSHERFQGFTVGSAYVTEAILCHMNSIEEIQTRIMSSSNRKLYMDLNPEPPSHPFYKKFLDAQVDKKRKNPTYGFNYGHFTIYDNMSIGNERLIEILDSYDRESLFFKMDILGKRVASVGRIYTTYDPINVVLPLTGKTNNELMKEYKIKHFSIGVDVGGTDATVVALVGFTAGYEKCYVIDGYYNKQGSLNDFYDETMYVNEIVDKIEGWIVDFGGLFQTPIFCDSAAKLFKRALQREIQRRQINMIVHKSHKRDGIKERIKLNTLLFSKRRFYVIGRPSLKEWEEAYENATWDEKAFNDGELVRLDNGTAPIDCLDATEYAFYPFKDKLV